MKLQTQNFRLDMVYLNLVFFKQQEYPIDHVRHWPSKQATK